MRPALNQSKFLDIAEAFMEQIIAGKLSPGDKIPSVRETAMKMGVTPNTAANAHARLRDLGIIEPRHGKGSIIQPGAQEICRSLIYKKFIDQELPVVQRRMGLLGLPVEQVITLLKKQGDK